MLMHGAKDPAYDAISVLMPTPSFFSRVRPRGRQVRHLRRLAAAGARKEDFADGPSFSCIHTFRISGESARSDSMYDPIRSPKPGLCHGKNDRIHEDAAAAPHPTREGARAHQITRTAPRHRESPSSNCRASGKSGRSSSARAAAASACGFSPRRAWRVARA